MCLLCVCACVCVCLFCECVCVYVRVCVCLCESVPIVCTKSQIRNLPAKSIFTLSLTRTADTSLTIWEHTHLFWLGDLNYRIDLSDIEVLSFSLLLSLSCFSLILFSSSPSLPPFLSPSPSLPLPLFLYLSSSPSLSSSLILPSLPLSLSGERQSDSRGLGRSVEI